MRNPKHPKHPKNLNKPPKLNKPQNPTKAVLTIVFATMVFIIFFITMLIIGSIIFVLNQVGIAEKFSSPGILLPVIGFGLASILIGTIVATILSSIPLKPVNKLIFGLNQLANGDYKTRINLGHNSIAEELSSSFNSLASELENTEMLRSDFVNNFSHEFKTPIVSICGFAKLLQKGTISKEQQEEYLAIIVDESTRLSDMATNILNLTKVENQTILTDITYFNLSEQIRNCILMLEKKWLEKGVTIDVDFNEHNINANEELLKQVWINLIDNAVKFSPKDGEINISIKETEDVVTVFVKNNGPKLSAEELRRIFDKFYQGDTSHASEGTGIGLSIARKITELHKGTISVTSSKDETIFSIELPKE